MNDEQTTLRFNKKGDMVKRYQNMEDGGDTDDDYNRYQATDRPLHSKYDPPRRSLAEQQSMKKSKTFFVYPNGDPSVKQFKLNYSNKKHKKLDTIFYEIEQLQVRVNFDCRTFKYSRVSRLFLWPSMTEVHHLSQLEEQDEVDTLIYSDSTNIKKKSVIENQIYGQSKVGNRTSRGSNKASPTLRSSNGANQQINFPVSIKVTSNAYKDRRCSLFINPKQQFPDVLDNITEMLNMTDNPVICLRPVKNMKLQVDSMSSFKRLPASVLDQFIAYADGESVQADSQSPTRNGKGARNGMANGQGRQSKNFKDTKGRTYQRHQQDTRRSQAEDEDPSPTQRSSRRDIHREGPYGSAKQEDTSPRRHREQNGYNRHNRDDDDDDNNSVPSRGNSPSGEEMQDRIDAMQDTSDNNLDRGVHY